MTISRATATALVLGATAALVTGCAPSGPATTAGAPTGSASPVTTRTAAAPADASPGATPGATPGAAPGATATPGADVLARAALNDAAGADKGTVTFADADGALLVSVRATGLEPGFHGLHVHAIGACEADSPDPSDATKVGDFLSSGGHLAGDGDAHPDHAGDLPALQVNDNGEATLVVQIDRLTRALLLDQDGSAVVVHSGADNYANIPERYAAAGADDETRKAGDAGSRVTCGVVRAS